MNEHIVNFLAMVAQFLEEGMKFNIICVYCFAFFFTFFLTYNQSFAACSCSPYMTYGFGYEYVAKTCPEDGENEETAREYEVTDLKCVGGTLQTALIHNPMNVSDGKTNTFTKDEIIAFARRDGNHTKIFVNESGTHVIAMHKSFTGQVVEGVSAQVGVIEREVFNKYCTHDAGLPDNDSDGFVDCLDCNDDDSDQNFGCPEPCTDCVETEKNLGPPVCLLPDSKY